MKRKIFTLTVIMLCFCVSIIAQNGTERIGINFRKYSKLTDIGNNPLIQNMKNAKALGVYTENEYPSSMLEINTTTQYTKFFHPNIANRGEVFRTVGPANVANYWRFITGATEKAALFVPANSNDLTIQTRFAHSSIRFNIGNNLQRMILIDGHGQGYLGIGNDFSNPQHMIHIYTTPNITGNPPPPAYAAFTNTNTGATATDGFLVGITANGNAQLIQQENLPMLFYTDDKERMRIDSNGFVGINPYPNYPNRRLDVFDKDFPQLRLTRNDTVTFTDFETTSNGKLLINPTDTMVGINLSIIDQPTQAIDVNGGARIRQLPVADTIMNVVVADNDGVLHVDTAFAGGGADNDWFVAGTVLPYANIDDNIYTQGFTGLGDFHTIIPQSLLHLYQPDIALYAQFTNDNTGNTVTDGFLAGINEDGVAQLNQQEDADMNFYTSNKLCLTITNKGKIKVNSFSSDKPHLLIADKDGTLMLCKLKKKEQKLPNLKHELNV